MNLEQIETLTELKMPTLLEAIEQRDPSLIRMIDGSSPTPTQLDHILTAGPAEFEAAKKVFRERAIRAENAILPPQRIEGLMRKYDASPTEPLGEVVKRMSEDDLAELHMLTRWMASDETRRNSCYGDQAEG